MNRAIVIGANGYLGRHICYFLSKRNIYFLPIGKAEKSIDNYSNYQSIDITNKEDVDKIDFTVDYVFMFAGATGTNNDEDTLRKFTKVNELGLKNVLDCCAKSIKNPKVIFPSSRLVYKGHENVFLSETAIKKPKTIYAQNKLNCESLLEQYMKEHNLIYTIFRICVPYGNLIDDSYSYGTVGFFLSKAKSKSNIPLYGDGSLKRTFTHIEDLINIILTVGMNSKSNNQTYNIGSNDNLSLKEVAQIIAQQYSVGVDFVEWPEHALKIESGDTLFLDEKIKNEFGVKYKNSIKDYFTSFE